MIKILLARVTYLKGLYRGLLLIILFVYILRFLDIYYLHTDWLKLNMLMIIGYSFIIGLESSNYANKDSLLKQLVSLPVNKREIWLSKFLLIIIPLIVIAACYILLVMILPKNMFDEIRDIVWVTFFYAASYFIVTSIINLKYTFICNYSLKEYLKFLSIVTIYLAVLFSFAYVVYVKTVVPNRIVLIIFLGIVFLITIFVDYKSFMKRKVFLDMF